MKTKKVQKIASMVIAGLGVILIILSIYAKFRIGEAKEQLNGATKPFSKNPFGNVAREAVEMKAQQYETMVMWCTTGGIILVVLGGALYFFNRRR